MIKTLICLLTLFTAIPGFGQKFIHLALTPPMGWNSWNRFGCDINEKVIRDAADAMVSSGMNNGIYSCAGRQTCGNKPGSRGHEFQDAHSYASFGVDFVKLDWCNSEGQNAVESYTLMRDALYASDRPIARIFDWMVSLKYSTFGINRKLGTRVKYSKSDY